MGSSGGFQEGAGPISRLEKVQDYMWAADSEG